jgi:hypothetical protein
VADLTQYLKLMPNYIRDFFQLISSPKRFLATRNKGRSGDWQKALLFFAISSGLSLLIRSLSYTTPTDFTTQLSRSVVAWIAGAMLFTLDIKVSWYLMRRSVPLVGTFLTQLYVYSIGILIITSAHTMIWNVIAILDPPFFEEFRKLVTASASRDALSELWARSILRPNFLRDFAVVTTFLIGSILFLTWCIACWGAYRGLNGASKTRSAFAFLTGLVLCIPVNTLIFVLTRGGENLR